MLLLLIQTYLLSKNTVEYTSQSCLLAKFKSLENELEKWKVTL